MWPIWGVFHASRFWGWLCSCPFRNFVLPIVTTVIYATRPVHKLLVKWQKVTQKSAKRCSKVAHFAKSCPVLEKLLKSCQPWDSCTRGHIRASNSNRNCPYKINLINIRRLKTRNKAIFPHLNLSRLTYSITGKLAINFFLLHLIFTSCNPTPKVRCTCPCLLKEVNRREFSL